MRDIRGLFVKAALTVMAAAMLCMSGCSKADKCDDISKDHEPKFTDICFCTSEEDMLAAEGEYSESYPSLYGGTVYVFPGREFNGVTGSVKYMTDDAGNIASISWLYEGDDTIDVQTRFENIQKGLEKKFGESGNKSDSGNNFGDMWYFDDVHIMIDAVITSEYKGMQLTYLKAEYSLKDTVDKKRQEREQAK